MNYHPENDITPEEQAMWEERAEKAGKGSGASPCSRRFADCDCEAQHPSDEYRGEECYQEVWICAECYTIIQGCGCGCCTEGATLQESD